MFKNLGTIVEVFGDRELSLIGRRPMYNHCTMVAAGRTWSQDRAFGRRLAARPSYDGRRAVGDF